MGIIKRLMKELTLDTPSSQPVSRTYEKQKRYHTPEEYVIHQQELSGEKWHGVQLSKLSKLAQTTYRGKYVEISKCNDLIFHYTSSSGKTKEWADCTLDENNLLVRRPHNYYPNQWRDSADDFVEKANQQFVFR